MKLRGRRHSNVKGKSTLTNSTSSHSQTANEDLHIPFPALGLSLSEIAIEPLEKVTIQVTESRQVMAKVEREKAFVVGRSILETPEAVPRQTSLLVAGESAGRERCLHQPPTACLFHPLPTLQSVLDEIKIVGLWKWTKEKMGVHRDKNRGGVMFKVG